MQTHAQTHSDPSNLTHSIQKQLSHPTEQNHSNMSLQLSQGDEQFTRMCQWSQGEVTNVSALSSSTQSDQEIVDIGSRDDITKLVSNCSSQASLTSFGPGFENLSNNASNSSDSSKDSVINKKKTKAINDKQLKKLQKEEKNKEKLSEKKKLKLQLLKKRKNVELKNIKDSSLCQKDPSANDDVGKLKKKRKDSNTETNVSKQSKVKNVLSEIGKKKKKSSVSKDSGKAIEEKAMLKDKDGVSEQEEYVKAWGWDGEGTIKKVVNIVSKLFFIREL